MSATPTEGAESLGERASRIAAKLRLGGATPSRGACWHCGLRRSATIHPARDSEPMAWWQHEYVPAILTKIR